MGAKMDIMLRIAFLSALYLKATGDFDGRWPRQLASSNGLCRYGARIDCCWGWTRRSWGQCQPLCQPGCKHGECVGPNKCKCYPGYTGKTCNQDEWEYATPPLWDTFPPLFLPVDPPPPAGAPAADFNECGLKPRPCKHRCMNTYGSYKCYCLNGYMLMPDGTCGNARSCSMANCQYGCDVVKGEVRCRCPSPGLQLGPDGRSCVDVDECTMGTAVCPRFRKCINTFGSYICKCHEGFDLQYVNGKYQCIDVNECLSSQHKCSAFAACYNTPGSYKCKCKGGFRGTGFDCKPIPKVNIDPYLPFKNNKPNNTNKIPDSDSKRKFTTPHSPITSKKPATTPAKPATTITTKVIHPAALTTKQMELTPLPTTSPPEVSTVDNRIQKEVTPKQRGDVHIPRRPNGNNIIGKIDIELGNTAEDEEQVKDDSDVLIHSCNFDHGLCGWMRNTEGDLHWETITSSSGGKYLTIPDIGGKRGGRVALLVLPLTELEYESDLCLSFSHKLLGHNAGTLQVYVKRNGALGPAVWGRASGNGWRQTQITLSGASLQSVIFKGERGKERMGEVGLDDINLRRGTCSDKHLRRH